MHAEKQRFHWKVKINQPDFCKVPPTLWDERFQIYSKNIFNMCEN